jgi:AraC-like DNA-binding protein
VLLFLIYLGASIHEYKKSLRSAPGRLLSKDSYQAAMRWIRTLLMIMSVFAFAWVLTVLAPYLPGVPIDVHYYPIEILLVAFVYWIAIAGYHKTKSIQLKAPVVVPVSVASQHEAQFEQLRNKMEMEQLFLDPELNVAKLSEKTGIPVKTISMILNQYYNTSFNDFVNGYRVNAVSSMLLNPANNNLTISGIAFDAGFNSQATFQRAFKKHTGMSPSEFMNPGMKKPA